MKKPCGMVIGLVGMTVLLAAQGRGQSSEPPAQSFPLVEGNRWVYYGTVKWTRPNSGDVIEQAIQWDMEVLKVVAREHVTGVLIKGFPSELAWYEDGQRPEEHLIVQVGPDKFYLLSGSQKDDAWAALQAGRVWLGSLLSESDLWLELPLMRGKVFGETESLTRPDQWYCWHVEEELPADLSRIRGLSSQPSTRTYQVALRTLPDHQIVSFVPGVGVTRYVYQHHGTVSEVDVSLVEFQQGPHRHVQ